MSSADSRQDVDVSEKGYNLRCSRWPHVFFLSLVFGFLGLVDLLSVHLLQLWPARVRPVEETLPPAGHAVFPKKIIGRRSNLLFRPDGSCRHHGVCWGAHSERDDRDGTDKVRFFFAKLA